MERRVIENEMIVLDGLELRDTHAIKCQIFYRGGKPPTIHNCFFDRCEWSFEGPAFNTLSFIRMLLSDAGDNKGMREFALRQILGIEDE